MAAWPSGTCVIGRLPRSCCLIAITAATTTLALGLALGGVTGQHYATTRAATAGPDVVAATVGSVPGDLPADLARLEQVSHSPGVTGQSGPFPVTFAALRTGGRTANVIAEGRGSDTAPVLYSWQAIQGQDGQLVENEQQVLLTGSLLLAEHLLLALAAAGIGLVAGWLAAPLVAVAMAVAVVATVIPAIGAARTSTVTALADAARPPRRRPWLIAISARLPVALLLGLRLAARRPRRTLLSGVSVAVAVTGIVAVLYARVSLDRFPGGYSGLDTQLDRVLLVVTVALIVLATVNAILIAWATVLDTRHTSALTRTLGATPQQVSTGLSAALVLPALAGALLAIPAGMEFFVAVAGGATLIRLPAWWLLATVLGTVAAVVALTAIPSLLGARRPVAEIIGSELA